MTTATMAAGIYFLANDHVEEETIAFLTSLRCSNPSIPLCLIPYDRRFQRILKMKKKYHFEVYEDEGYLKFCDAVGRIFCFHREAIGTFRKLALWNGPFENFIYLDVDTVVFKNLDFLFECLKEYDYLSASQGDIPQVWNDSVYGSGELTLEQIRYSCNTGFILSNKQMFFPDSIRLGVESARRMKKHMLRETLEQSLFNYLIVKSNKRYGSIYEVFPNLGNEWAGVSTHRIREDGTMTDSEERELLFLHWAGFDGRLSGRIEMPYRKIWEYYRFLPLVSKPDFYDPTPPLRT